MCTTNSKHVQGTSIKKDCLPTMVQLLFVQGNYHSSDIQIVLDKAPSIALSHSLTCIISTLYSCRNRLHWSNLWLQIFILPMNTEELLNQARAWFLKIVSVRTSVCVCGFVYLHPRLLITSGMMWCDIVDPIQLVKQALKLLYGNCSHIINGYGLGIGTHHRH